MEKKIIMFSMILFSSLGGYIPSFFGADFFSFSSILCTMFGGFFGVWIANKVLYP